MWNRSQNRYPTKVFGAQAWAVLIIRILSSIMRPFMVPLGMGVVPTLARTMHSSYTKGYPTGVLGKRRPRLRSRYRDRKGGLTPMQC
jgi:hypothetical protein